MAVRRFLVAGRYRLHEPVGSGGMGRVWMARDEMLDRDVAVKEFVPPEWMTDAEKARLRDRTLREARSAARLNHPHVVRIYDVVHADDLPWIVMEYVPSRSLHQVINEDGPFAPVAAARVGLDVLSALTAAHRAGVLHRDVKPHNVLIGSDGRVVLTDFGLATFVDDGAVTGPGLVVGSPQYVSPERARDGASTVESDLWSLGATMYAAVEGRSPYARETAMATLMALATEQPDPSILAGPLAPVIGGLLQHDPADRLTAIEVEKQLRAIASPATAQGRVARGRVAPRPRRSGPADPGSAAAPRSADPGVPGRAARRNTPRPTTPSPTSTAQAPASPPASMSGPATAPPGPTYGHVPAPTGSESASPALASGSESAPPALASGSESAPPGPASAPLASTSGPISAESSPTSAGSMPAQPASAAVQPASTSSVPSSSVRTSPRHTWRTAPSPTSPSPASPSPASPSPASRWSASTSRASTSRESSSSTPSATAPASSPPYSPFGAPASDAPDQPGRSRRLWRRRWTVLAGALVLALLAGGAVVANQMVQRRDRTVGAQTPPPPSVAPMLAAPAVAIGFTPVSCEQTPPPQLPRTPQDGASEYVKGFRLLPSWHEYVDVTGFRIGVPDGWTYQRIGTTVCFRDPDNLRFLSVDPDRNPAGNPIKACTTEAQRLVGSGKMPKYELVSLVPAALQPTAADWEYSWLGPTGVRMHAKTRWSKSGTHAYAISWATRDFEWQTNTAYFGAALSYFTPIQ